MITFDYIGNKNKREKVEIYRDTGVSKNLLQQNKGYNTHREKIDK